MNPEGTQALPVYEINGSDSVEFGYCRTQQKYFFQFAVEGAGIIRTHLSFAEALNLATSILKNANERFQAVAAEVKAEEAADAALQAEIAEAQAEHEPKRFRDAEGA